jgi:hypothetical protein
MSFEFTLIAEKQNNANSQAPGSRRYFLRIDYPAPGAGKFTGFIIFNTASSFFGFLPLRKLLNVPLHPCCSRWYCKKQLVDYVRNFI